MEIVKDESRYGMLDWWKKVVLDNYANFEGRARRSEYWYFILLNNVIIPISIYIIAIVLVFIGGFLLIPLLWLFGLGTLIPHLAVAARRLHDTGKSAWFLLLWFAPIVGPIILIVFFATEGDRGPNEYGPDPKEVNGPQIGNIGKE